MLSVIRRRRRRSWWRAKGNCTSRTLSVRQPKVKWKKKRVITRTHLGSSGMASNDYRKMSNGMLERRTTDIVTTAAIRSQLLEQSDALLQPSPSSQDWRQPLTYLITTQSEITNASYRTTTNSGGVFKWKRGKQTKMVVAYVHVGVYGIEGIWPIYKL